MSSRTGVAALAAAATAAVARATVCTVVAIRTACQGLNFTPSRAPATSTIRCPAVPDISTTLAASPPQNRANRVAHVPTASAARVIRGESGAVATGPAPRPADAAGGKPVCSRARSHCACGPALISWSSSPARDSRARMSASTSPANRVHSSRTEPSKCWAASSRTASNALPRAPPASAASSASAKLSASPRSADRKSPERAAATASTRSRVASRARRCRLSNDQAVCSAGSSASSCRASLTTARSMSKGRRKRA